MAARLASNQELASSILVTRSSAWSSGNSAVSKTAVRRSIRLALALLSAPVSLWAAFRSGRFTMYAFVLPHSVSRGAVIAGSSRRFFRPSWERLEERARAELSHLRPGAYLYRLTREIDLSGRRSVIADWRFPFETGR